MNMLHDHGLLEAARAGTQDLSGMPEAFQRAIGPEKPFANDFGELERPDVAPLPYRGHRSINPRSRGSCRLFAVLPDLETGLPRVYGLDSQTEYHHLALTLVDPNVRQVHEQYGPIPFIDDEGKRASHYFDLVITYKSGRRVAVAVKPTGRLKSGRFFRELKQLVKTMPPGLFDEVRLVTEQCFKRSDAGNAVNYLRFALCPDPHVDRRLAETLPSIHGQIRIGDLIELSRTGERGFRAAFRAIYEGKLERISPGRINLFTLVRRPS